MRTCKLILFLVLISISSAKADETGNELLNSCKSEVGSHPFSFCMGYVNGMAQGFRVATDFMCLPAKSTYGQVIDVVVDYLEENPSMRHLSAAFLVMNALFEAFPCNDLSHLSDEELMRMLGRDNPDDEIGF
ncbi:MAG: hypothetical protein GYB19_10145 [Rhodospirillales bacterium]|nr:hypothetical protein [Rhodospirillales bacterium]